MRFGNAAERACHDVGVKLVRPWSNAAGSVRSDIDVVWREDMRALFNSDVAIVFEGASLGEGIQVSTLQGFSRPAIVMRPVDTPRSPLFGALPLWRLVDTVFHSELDLVEVLRKELHRSLPILRSARAVQVRVARQRTSTLGQKLRGLRAREHVTIADLSRRTTITEGWLQAIETEPWAMWIVSFGELALIADALSASVWDLLVPPSHSILTSQEDRIFQDAAVAGNWESQPRERFRAFFENMWTRGQGPPLTVGSVTLMYRKWKRQFDYDGGSSATAADGRP